MNKGKSLMSLSQFANFLKSDSQNLTPTEILQSSVNVLMGVREDALPHLEEIGVKTVFDLGVNSLFQLARTISQAASGGSGSTRFGLVSNDWLHADPPQTALEQLDTLDIKFLRGISAERANAFKATFGTKTIREFAIWGPYLAASLVVSESIGGTTPVSALTGEDNASDLLPRFGEYPTERVYYERLVMLDMGQSTDTLAEVKKPLSLNDALKAAPSTTRVPAVGALVTLSQSWYVLGITLGQMLHSLALAPGESTRIAVIDWSRKTRSSSAEEITEAEALQSSTSHSRAISEVQSGVASDLQSGGATSSVNSRSETSSNQDNSFNVSVDTFNLFSPSGGISDSANVSQSASSSTNGATRSWSSGTRTTVAEMAQNVNDSTEQHSSSVRSRRASAVKEVSQSEHEKISTRLVANYNHMHALTVQYYEVVQVYRTVADIHRVDRCLFIPMDLVNFDDDIVSKFRGALFKAALSREVAGLLADDTTAVTLNLTASTPSMPYWAVPDKAASTNKAAFSNGEIAGTVPTNNQATGGERVPARPTVASSPTLHVWDKSNIARISKIIGQSLFRRGVNNPMLPDDTELLAISFEGVAVDKVQLSASGEMTTHSIAQSQNWVAIPASTYVIELDSILVSKRSTAAAKGKMTLSLAYMGRRFELNDLPIELPEETMAGSFFKIATLSNDQENRKTKLLKHLNANQAHYSRAIFRSLDSSMIATLLAGHKWKDKPLIEVVEPRVLAIAGDYLVFSAPVDDEESSGVASSKGTELTWSELLKERHFTGIKRKPDTRLIPIPTAGVFAEAVLGRSNSAEKLDITRFWNWQDSPIPLQAPEIAAIQSGSRAQPDDTKPGQLGQPVLNIVNPSALPDPAGLGAVLGALQNGNMFRDMSGMAQLMDTMKSAQQSTTNAATDAGQIASANMRASMQRQVALAQVAGDVVKTIATKGVASGGGGSKGISAEGAKINHGRDMDSRGVQGAPNQPNDIRSQEGSPNVQIAGNNPVSQTRNGQSTNNGREVPPSYEASYSDKSALGFSPTANKAESENFANLIRQVSSPAMGYPIVPPVNPSIFAFKAINAVDDATKPGGWRETPCLEFGFRFGGGDVGTQIPVRIIVGTPLKNHKGWVGERYAQETSADAAWYAAMACKAALDSGPRTAVEIEQLFRSTMQIQVTIPRQSRGL
ncbi:MAG: hypothetical protein ACRCWJ_19590 [Casimicrobium sp.]